MKKLLAVLSSISILSVSSATVVSCGNKYDKKDNGNSVLIDGLGSLDFNGGKTKITSSDALKEIIDNGGDSSLREKIITRFINLMSANFLIQSKKDDTTYNHKDDAYIVGLKDRLENAYTELDSSVNIEIKNEKAKYKTDYGKKADSKWKDMLKGKFPGITDSKTLEDKYKESKLLTGDDNVNSRLLKVLLQTNELGVQWVTKKDLQLRYNDYFYLNDEQKKEWRKANHNVMQELLWSNVDEGAYAKEEDDKLEDTFIAKFKAETISSDLGLIKKDAPTSIEYLKGFSDNYTSKGFLSASQIFFLKKYYEDQLPVAISQVTIAFASNGTMDDGIDYTEDFAGKNPTNSDVKRVKDVDAFLGNVNSNFNEILAGKTFDNITSKSISSLLTLSDSSTFSQQLRNSVYDFIKGTQQSGKGTNLADIVSGAKRDGNTTMYSVVDADNGIIAFVDSGGLEVVRIEGWKKLNTKNLKLGEKNYSDNLSEDDLKINNMKELSAFQEFGSMTDNEKVQAIQSDTNTFADSNLNTALNDTPYLKFLVNQSLIKGLSGSYTSFDIMDSVNSFVSITTPSSSGTYTYWTALIDYFWKMQKPESDSSDLEGEWFNSFFTAGEGEDSDTAKQIIQDVWSWIKVTQNNVVVAPVSDFMAAQDTENDSITNNSNVGYPKGIFTTFNWDYIGLLKEKLKATSKSQLATTDFKYDLKIRDYLTSYGGKK